MIPAALEAPYRQYESSSDEIHDLRLRLLAAEEDVLLAKDELTYAESTILQTIEGKNAEERKANFTIAVQDHEGYQKALTALRAKQHLVGKLQADIERSQARERGWLWVIRYVAGLDARTPDDA